MPKRKAQDGSAPRTVTLNGSRYSFAGLHKTRERALSVAKNWRDKGHNAQVVEIEGTDWKWGVYADPGP